MKKRNILLSLLFLSLITGCSYFEAFLGSTDSSYGSFVTNSSSSSGSSSSSTQKEYVNESPLHEKLYKNDDFNVGLPSTGDVRVLVVPIEIGNDTFTDEDLNNLNLAFNGTSEETGWESVNSYYNKVSKGKLNIEADITPVYSTGKSKAYYEAMYLRGKDPEYDLLKNILPALEEMYDLSNYDFNKDGYIDSIYLIYSCDYSMSDSSPYWAWCYEYFTDKPEYYDGVEADYYVWASIDFLYDPIADKNIKVNAETIIHETGHLFGLDDYYDYDEFKGPDGGVGGAAMMDCNVGDHDSFSKILMGWATPTIVNETGLYTIKPSNTSNDCLLIPLRESDDIIFSEYLIIDLYTPDGINEVHAGNYGLFDKAGVRIYHIDARIDPNLGSPQNELGYYTIFSFNNSDTKYKIIDLIEADNNNSISKLGYASNSDLFEIGDSLKNVKNHDGETSNYEIRITFANSEKATIRIVKNEG